MGKGWLPGTHEFVITTVGSFANGECDVAIVVGAILIWLLH